MSDDLAKLEAWAGELLARLDDGQRRRIARDVAIDLRRSQVRRIAAQQDPDGAAFAPRKRAPLRAKSGRLKRQAAMFPKLRRATYMRTAATTDEAAVGFRNATVARVARVHHHGLRDRVERRQGAPEVTYPRRRLLGLSEEDRGRIMDLIVQRIEG